MPPQWAAPLSGMLSFRHWILHRAGLDVPQDAPLQGPVLHFWVTTSFFPTPAPLRSLPSLPWAKYRFHRVWCCSAASLLVWASRSSGAPWRACWCGRARSPRAATGSRSSHTWPCRRSRGWPSSARHRHLSSSSGCSMACGKREGGTFILCHIPKVIHPEYGVDQIFQSCQARPSSFGLLSRTRPSVGAHWYTNTRLNDHLNCLRVWLKCPLHKGPN